MMMMMESGEVWQCAAARSADKLAAARASAQSCDTQMWSAAEGRKWNLTSPVFCLWSEIYWLLCSSKCDWHLMTELESIKRNILPFLQTTGMKSGMCYLLGTSWSELPESKTTKSPPRVMKAQGPLSAPSVRTWLQMNPSDSSMIDDFSPSVIRRLWPGRTMSLPADALPLCRKSSLFSVKLKKIQPGGV